MTRCRRDETPCACASSFTACSPLLGYEDGSGCRRRRRLCAIRVRASVRASTRAADVQWAPRQNLLARLSGRASSRQLSNCARGCARGKGGGNRRCWTRATAVHLSSKILLPKTARPHWLARSRVRALPENAQTSSATHRIVTLSQTAQLFAVKRTCTDVACAAVVTLVSCMFTAVAVNYLGEPNQQGTLTHEQTHIQGRTHTNTDRQTHKHTHTLLAQFNTNPASIVITWFYSD